MILDRRLLLLAAATGGNALAQATGPIVTDRPGFNSSPAALDPGILQIEAGYLFASDDAGSGIDAQSLPAISLRYGLIDDLELLVGWGGYAWLDIAGGDDSSGMTDASIGVRWQLADDDATVPLALFAGINLPVGASAVSSDESDPSVGAFWSYSAGLDWYGTVLLTNLDDTARVNYAVGLNLPINDKIGSFVEYLAVIGDGGPEHYLNSGFIWLPRPDLQWDTWLGLGLNDRSVDIAFNLGLSYRY